jgi:hypothetical protein
MDVLKPGGSSLKGYLIRVMAPRWVTMSSVPGRR